MTTQFLHGVEVVEITDGVRPISTVRSSVIGLVGPAPDADDTAFPLNTPVLLTGPRQAAALGNGGTLKSAYEAIYAQGAALVVVVRIDPGADEAATLAAIAGSASEYTGVHALLRAQELAGVTPRILAAPGFTGQRPLDGADPPVAQANPVVTAILPVAERLRAVVVADGPNTTQADAFTYAGDWGSDRLYVVDPEVRVFDPVTATTVTRSGSPYAAGAIAARDIKRGFWWSPSNQVVAGVTGVARPISFALSDPEAESNLLNEAGIATFIQSNGWRLWGNRTQATDPLWKFLPVRRTADLIYESIERTVLWAVDRPITPQLVVDVRDTVQAYIDRLVSRGALLGGRTWFDPELNPVTALQSGQITLDFDIEPPSTAERITFRAHRNGQYYETLSLALADATV